MASHHTGVGLTAEQILHRKLPLPAVDLLAETVEEELVMYADAFHTKSVPPVLVPFARYRELCRVRTG